MPPRPADPIREAIDGRHAVIHLHSSEEARVIGWLRRLAAERYGGVPLYTWTCTRGLDGDLADEATRDPVAAIQAAVRSVTQAGRPGLFVMHDLSAFLTDPRVARALRDACDGLSGRFPAAILILSPELVVPPSLEKDLHVVQIPLPDTQELAALAQTVAADHATVALPEGWLKTVAPALKGLTLEEALHVMHRALSAETVSPERILEGVQAAKKSVASGTACLTYVPHDISLDSVGGLHSLKDWIARRRAVFTQSALEAGYPMPKGILVMGISGCGKSLCAKVVARTWRVPLFRLDMNLVYANESGTPEATFHQALQTVEAVAPVVLWIDEIENGLGLTEQHNQTSQHILSAFLTWMQEKPPLIFVAATANRIEALPAELIRKGRFDQVFFCDLPDEGDRNDIFVVHLKANGADPANFDLPRLVRGTLDWNAAEIEQAVIAARIDAALERRAFNTEDILTHMRSMVPLSQTMSEQIKFIRDWAWDRATPASRPREVRFD